MFDSCGGGCSPIRTGLPAIFKMQGDSAEMQGGAPRTGWTKSNIYNGMQDCLPTQGAGRPFIASRDIQGGG